MDKNIRLLIGLIVAVVALALVYWLRIILAPFVFAMLMAYLGDPLVDRIVRAGLTRTLAVSLVFVAMTLLVILCVLLLVPMIASQIDLFTEVLPGYIAWLRETMLPAMQHLLGVDEQSELISKVKVALNQNWERASDILVLVLAKVTQSGLAVAAWLGSVALIPVVTFYLLRDWDKLIEHIQDLLPRSSVDTISRLAKECDEVLGAFLRGQLLIMIALGVVYTAGLLLVGLDLALLVGLLAGTAA
ncbi:AI-2E family transporter, partial [Pseudomonadales bacterium]|nr:AI-2E family transporter [Pseudomonadales bacterium]